MGEEIKVHVRPEDPGFFYASIPYGHLNRIHRIGGKWVQSLKEWKFPFDDDVWSRFREQFYEEFREGNVKKDLGFILAFDKRRRETADFLKFKEEALMDAPTDFGVDGVSLNGKNCLFNYQRWGVKCGLSVGDGFLIGDMPGLGKSLASDTPVITPEGRRPIGSVKVGDEVMGRDGFPHRVTGVYPQGTLRTYRVSFSDGCSVECSGDHLWTVYDKCGLPITLTVDQMLDRKAKKCRLGEGFPEGDYEISTCFLDGKGKPVWRVPISRAVHFAPGRPLPVDPYLFGRALGAGHFRTDGTMEFSMRENDFSDAGYAVPEDPAPEDSAEGPQDSLSFRRDRGKVSVSIPSEPFREFGLAGKFTWERWIPDACLMSGIQDRLALLQGLMDAGGYCDRPDGEGGFQGAGYRTGSAKMADCVADLVRSIGGMARRLDRKTFYRKEDGKHFCRTEYKVKIWLPPGLYPFRISRKGGRLRMPNEAHRFISGIEPCGESDCTCIGIDSVDHLYLAGDFVVTHNTIQGIGIAVERRNRGEIRNCLIVCPASLKYNWKEEIAKFTGEEALVVGHKCKDKEARALHWVSEGYFFKIANYEILARDLYCEPGKQDNRISCAKAVLNSFDMAVFDECFSYYSQVMLEDGSTECIGEIVCKSLPVKVRSYNWKTGRFEARRILTYFDNGSKPLLMLTTGLGTVHVTANHKYYRLDGAEVLAGGLRPGDRIAAYSENGLSETEVVNVEPMGIHRTYNIEVEGNHNYVCGGSLVSNCQYLKHHSSLRTRACREINAKYRVGLSGTPLDGRLEEIHSIFQILKPGLFVSKQKFMERYAELDYFGAVKGYHHIREVSDKIAPYYLRRRKEDVLKDLPPKIFKDMHVELSAKNMSDYKAIVKRRNEITTEASAMELVLRARQFLDFPDILGMKNKSDKYVVFKELIDDLVGENGLKVIVFTDYTETLHRIKRNLEADGYSNILVIEGSVKSEERQRIVNAYNSEEKYKIILMSNSGAEGLNLQSAYAVINYTSSFQPTKMQQRADRAHRATTTHAVTIYRFIVDGTIDEHVMGILGRKMAVNNALLGEDCDEFEYEGLGAMELLSCL